MHLIHLKGSITFCLIVFSFIFNIQAQDDCWGGKDAEPGDDYVLVWADEFDLDGALCMENWHHQTQLPNGDSWFNGEEQHYTSRLENTYVEDGMLHIVAMREEFTDQGVTKSFTSARLNSKFAFTYGKVEVRAQLPSGEGTWPAIWTLGQSITEAGAYWADTYGDTSWPACGEIDIMEHWGFNPNVIQAATHTPSSSGNTVNKGSTEGEQVSERFHVYGMEWTPTEIRFYLNQEQYYTYRPSNRNDSTWPFDEPQYLLLNIALGGVGGTIDPAFTESSMLIDYVRIYQREEPSNGGEVDVLEVAAPMPPERNPEDVLSIFSDAYMDLSGTSFDPDWGQETSVTIGYVNDNQLLKYSNFNYQGIQLQTAHDVQDFDYLHVDVWTENAMFLEVSPVNQNGTPIEVLKPLEPLLVGEWNSFELHMQDFADGGMGLDAIYQMKFDAQKGSVGGTVYLDNLYFYKGEPLNAVLSVEKDMISSKVYTAKHTLYVHSPYSDALELSILSLDGRSIRHQVLEGSSEPHEIFVYYEGLAIVQLVDRENSFILRKKILFK